MSDCAVGGVCGCVTLITQVDTAEINKVFATFDPDGSGSIEFKELNRLVRRGPPHTPLPHPPTPLLG